MELDARYIPVVGRNDDPINEVINKTDKVVRELFGKEDWGVYFKSRNSVYLDETRSFYSIKVIERIEEDPPGHVVDEQQKIENPLKAIANNFVECQDKIEVEEFFGFKQEVNKILFQSRNKESLESQKDVISHISNNNFDRISDEFGHQWTDLQTNLANKCAEITQEGQNEVLITFDILRKLLESYKQSINSLMNIASLDEDNLDVEEAFSLETTKILKYDNINEKDVPIKENVYIRQSSKSITSENHQISSQQIRETIRETIIGRGEKVYLPEVGDSGIGAKIGKTISNSNSEVTQGIVPEEANIHIVHNFWSALKVDDEPFLTSEIIEKLVEDKSQFPFDNMSPLVAHESRINLHESENGINHGLELEGYWRIKGTNYEDKSKFKEHVEELKQTLEEQLDKDVEIRSFDETKTSKIPIRQRDIIEKIEEENLVDEQEFGSLENLVVDTNIVDAGVISELVTQGELYGSKIIIPEIAILEIHKQAEEGRKEGKEGMAELERLRKMCDAGIIELEVPSISLSFDSATNAEIDHQILNEAKNRGATLCTDDEKLFKIAKIMDVDVFRLKQNISQPASLIENILEEESPQRKARVINEFTNRVIAARPERPSMPPHEANSKDVSSEMEARDLINNLERRGKVYTEGGLVGKVKQPIIVPKLDSVKKGLLSQAIEQDRISDKLDIPSQALKPKVILPEFIHQWANIEQKSEVQGELNTLRELDSSQEISLESNPPELTYKEILSTHTEFVRKSLRGLIQEKKQGNEELIVIEPNISESNVIYRED